jgi:ferredoxin
LLPGAPNGAVYICDTCIGCGNCERDWQWLLRASAKPGVATKVYDKSMVKKAVKGDTCRDLPHGPACVSACPTGAALRVSPERFLNYTNPLEA